MFKLLTLIATTIAVASGQNCVCGVPPTSPSPPKSSLSQYIIGGFDAPTDSNPWLVTINYYGRAVCGGTLINSHFVLTAAHCIKAYRGSVGLHKLTVKLGPKSLNDLKAMSVNVARVHLHPEMGGIKRQNDIGLIELKDPVDLTKFTPACLPNANSTTSSNGLVAVGFGKSGKLNGQLQAAPFIEMPIEECIRQWPRWISRDQVCAGGLGQATCLGDFGGPLLANNNGSAVVFGVASYSWCKKTIPSVFVRVTSYLGWIDWVTRYSSTVPATISWCSDNEIVTPTPPPTTANPTTGSPTTDVPTTAIPTTDVPTTGVPPTNGPAVNAALNLLRDPNLPSQIVIDYD